MRAWAWVQTGRVSLRSFAVRSTRCSDTRKRDGERKQTARRTKRKRERERERRIRETLERRGESSSREARSRPGWAGSVRTLKNLWPALRPTSKRCYSRVLGAGTVRFTQRRQERKKERAREKTRRKGIKGDPRTRACTLTKRAIELVNVHPDNR